jgi:hypothetical protein
MVYWEIVLYDWTFHFPNWTRIYFNARFIDLGHLKQNVPIAVSKTFPVFLTGQLYVKIIFVKLIFCRLSIGLWRPEYAEYMVEGTPGKPYESDLAYFNVVESNMKRR